MRIVDFININMGTLELLSRFGVRTDDFKYVDLFADYEDMLEKGEKASYIVAVLAERYSTSESSVYRILRRFKATV